MLSIQMLADMCCPVCHTDELGVEVRKQEDNKIIEGDLHCEKCKHTNLIQMGVPNIPFRNDTFSHLVVTAALDHFGDLVAFSKEATRVLRPAGKLHLVQSVHGVKGPGSAVKMLAHWVKDTLEDKAAAIGHPSAPHHMTEFTTPALYETVNRYFTIEEASEYSVQWYSPTNIFLKLAPRFQRHENDGLEWPAPEPSQCTAAVTPRERRIEVCGQ